MPAQKILQKLLLPKSLPKKSTIKQFVFSGLTDKFGLNRNSLIEDFTIQLNAMPAPRPMMLNGKMVSVVEASFQLLGLETRLAENASFIHCTRLLELVRQAPRINECYPYKDWKTKKKMMVAYSLNLFIFFLFIVLNLKQNK
ncbi:hypothetical protein ENBRE01_0066 [Enteropsectra breve]|nr:hypothetical protein ENBRE01_0066 [Enteropsectra breve]